MPSGKQMIVDAGAINGKTLTNEKDILYTEAGQRVKAGEDVDGYKPHWGSCKYAGRFKR